MDVSYTCQGCGVVFTRPGWRPPGKFCSHACCMRSPRSEEQRRKMSESHKGTKKPWVKGNGGATKGRKATAAQLEGLRAGWNAPKRPPTPEAAAEFGRRMTEYRETHGSPVWKGDQVGYVGLHAWAAHNFDDPGRCEFCEIRHPRLEWAQRHGREGSRSQEDWHRLCKRCHWHYDQCRKPDCGHCEAFNIEQNPNATPRDYRAMGQAGARSRWAP